MRKVRYFYVLLVVSLMFLIVASCTNNQPVNSEISLNITLVGEAENVKYSNTTLNFSDTITITKYKVYLYRNGAPVPGLNGKEFPASSGNKISFTDTTIKSGLYKIRIEAYNNAQAIYYGEKDVQLSYGRNDITIDTHFCNAKLSTNVENQVADKLTLKEISISGTLQADESKNFRYTTTFTNMDIYPGVWEITFEATLTLDDSPVKLTYKDTYEIYPSQTKTIKYMINRSTLEGIYIDVDVNSIINLPYLQKVWNLKYEKLTNGSIKLSWDYDLPATFTIYRGNEIATKSLGSTTDKYFVDETQEISEDHYYVNAIYDRKESGLCELVVDLGRPKVWITNPKNGALAFKMLNIQAVAQDNGEIVKIEFYVDGIKIGEDNTEPFECNWDTKNVANGFHSVTAKAYDNEGYYGFANIQFMINNDSTSRSWEKTYGGTTDDVAYFIQPTGDGGYIVAGYKNVSSNYDIYVLKLNSSGETVWQKTLGGSGDDIAYCIQQTSDGGYLIGGYTTSAGSGGRDAYILKLDSSGNLLWQRIRGYSGTEVLYSIQQTSDGGFIAVGYTTSLGAGSRDVYVLKFDSSATLEWEKTFGGSSDEEGESITQTFDGGYVLTGYTNSFGSGYSDVYVLKLNSVGTTEWQKTFGGSYYDGGKSIQQTADSGFIIAGYYGYYDYFYVLKLNSSGAFEWEKKIEIRSYNTAYSIIQAPDGEYVFTGSMGSDYNTGYDIYVAKLSNSGAIKWQRKFGGNNDDYAYCVQATTDGGYVIAGSTYSLGNGGSDVYILKLDSGGDLFWQKMFGGNSDDYARFVQRTTDGNYVALGYTNSYGSGNYDIYLLKLNPYREVIWAKTFGGSSNDYGYFIQQTADSGYLIAGETSSFGAGNSDAYILKLNSDGIVQWTKTFGGSSYDVATSIQDTSDGGYLVVGHTKSFGAGGWDVYILKLDSQRSLEWQKTLGGAYDDRAYCVKKTNDGGFIIVGNTCSFGDTNGDIYAIKLSASGNVEWEKTFGGGYYDDAYSVEQNSDGTYIICGKTKSFGDTNGDAYVIKVNSSGTLVWEKTFGSSATEDGFYSIQKTPDNEYILVGYYGSDAYVVKLNSSGTFGWSKTFGGNGSEWLYSITPTLDGGYISVGTSNSFRMMGYDIYTIKFDSTGVPME